MKLLATGDWHGKIMEIKEKPDIIVYIGDFCDFSKVRKIIFELKKMGLSEEEFKREYKKRVKNVQKEVVKSGRKVLDYLNSIGVPVINIPGNVDPKPREVVELWKKDGIEYDFPLYWEDFIKGYENIVDTHLKIVKVQGLKFFGIICESYKENETRYKFYKKFYPKEEFDILISHLPPFDTELDVVRVKESPRYGEHIGSIVVKELIENYQPKFCFCGHLHENSGIEIKIGKTRVINVAQRLYYINI